MLLPSYPAAQHTHTIKHTHTQTHSQTHTHSTATHTHISRKQVGGKGDYYWPILHLLSLPSYPAAQHTHTHNQAHTHTHTHTNTFKIKHTHRWEGRGTTTDQFCTWCHCCHTWQCNTHTHNQAHTHTYKKGGGWGWRVGGDCYWPVLHSMSLLSYPASQPLWHMPVLESQGSPPVQLPQENAQSRPYFMGLHSENVTH